MNAGTIGRLLLFAGFLAGAYVTVAQVEAVSWLHYGVCAGLMLVGLALVRTGRGAEAGETEKHEGNLDVLEESVGRLIERVGAYTAIESDVELVGLHARIDAELMAHLDQFVEARESMIPRLGMQAYADIMSPFATGERILNRAWSASVDGYVDEVRSCVRQALAQLEDARARLREARGARE